MMEVSCNGTFEPTYPPMSEHAKVLGFTKQGLCTCGNVQLRTKKFPGGWKETGNICEPCTSPSGGIVEPNGVVDEVSTDNMEAMFLNLIRNAKEGKEAQSIMNVQLAAAAKNILESEKNLKAENEAHKATKAEMNKQIAEEKSSVLWLERNNSATKAVMNKQIAEEKAKYDNSLAHEKTQYSLHCRAWCVKAEKEKVKYDKLVAKEKAKYDKLVAEEKAKYDKQAAHEKTQYSRKCSDWCVKAEKEKAKYEGFKKGLQRDVKDLEAETKKQVAEAVVAAKESTKEQFKELEVCLQHERFSNDQHLKYEKDQLQLYKELNKQIVNLRNERNRLVLCLKCSDFRSERYYLCRMWGRAYWVVQWVPPVIQWFINAKNGGYRAVRSLCSWGWSTVAWAALSPVYLVQRLHNYFDKLGNGVGGVCGFAIFVAWIILLLAGLGALLDLLGQSLCGALSLRPGLGVVNLSFWSVLGMAEAIVGGFFLFLGVEEYRDWKKHAGSFTPLWLVWWCNLVGVVCFCGGLFCWWNLSVVINYI